MPLPSDTDEDMKKPQSYWTTQLLIVLLLHLKGVNGEVEKQEPDWKIIPYVVVPGPQTTQEKEDLGLWESTAEKLFEEESFGVSEDDTRKKRQIDSPVEEVEFRVKTVEGLGKVLEIARRPLKTSIHGLTHTLDLSAFAEREEELGRSAQVFLKAKRMTDATITNRFSPAGNGENELRFWPRMSYETCQMTCASHEANIISDYQAWKDACETERSLSAWVKVEQTQEELVIHEERLPRFPMTIATWGGEPLEEQCRITNAFVSALGEVGVILPSHANRTSYVETADMPIKIFNSKNGESISDLMWSTDPTDKLEPHFYSRYPNQHEGKQVEKYPEMPRMALIMRPTEYRVWANFTGCYATINQVASWDLEDQQCVCQRAPRDSNKRDEENLAMRREQNRLTQNSLRSFVDPIDKRKIKYFPDGGRSARATPEQYLMERIPKLNQRFDRRTWQYLRLQLETNTTRVKRNWALAWSTGVELVSVLARYAEKKIKNLNPEKLVDSAVHYMTNLMFGTKPMKKKRIQPEVLLTPSQMPRVAKRLGLTAHQGILKASPKESITKQENWLILSDNTAEQALKATGPAVIELDEAKALREEFYKYELIPSLPPGRIQELEHMGEEIVDAEAVIYDIAPGKSGMYLLFATERRDHKVKPEYSYIPLPENMNAEDHQYPFPEFTHKCREVLLDHENLTKLEYEEKCPPRAKPMNGHTEHVFPEDKFSVQRFISPDTTVLNVACPMTGNVREVCRGTCALRMGDECTMQYRGASSSDGIVPSKADQTYNQGNRGMLAKTYEMLSNEKVLEIPPWRPSALMFWFGVTTFIVLAIIGCAVLGWVMITAATGRRMKASRNRRNSGEFGTGNMVSVEQPADEENYETCPVSYIQRHYDRKPPTANFVIPGSRTPEKKVGFICHASIGPDSIV